MARNMNPASLANLNRGGRVPLNYDGQNLVVQGIADALEAEGVTDDEIRHYLCKFDGFVVTQEVRAEVLRRRALQIYRTIFNSIFEKTSKGEAVSINGFATFERVGPDNLVAMCRIFRGETVTPFMPDDVAVSEVLVAVPNVGCWQGSQVLPVEVNSHEDRAAGMYDEWIPATGQYLPIEGRRKIVGGEWFGIKNELRVTGTGDDGIVREYVAGGLRVSVVVSRHLRQKPDSSDLQEWWRPVPNQSAAMEEILGFNRLAPGNIDAIGWHYPMAVDEWNLVKDRSIEEWPVSSVAAGVFNGMPAHNALGAFPRTQRIVRKQGSVWTFEKISKEQFFREFEHLKDYLQGLGAWPGYARYLKTVKANFRKEFIEAVRLV